MSLHTLSPGIRAIFFDAVGTLLHPEPPVAVAYARAGARWGSRLGPEVIVPRFRAAFRRQEEQDRAAGYRTSEEREIARWRAIVTEVLDDVTDLDSCFQDLYDYFAQPAAWRIDPDAGPVLRTLAKLGFHLGVCSNFDHRLHGLVKTMPELRDVRHVIVSSEVGWKKPAVQFFAAVTAAVQLGPEQVLIVGDDEENDFDGGRAAGFEVVLLDPQGRSSVAPHLRLGRLSDLVHSMFGNDA